MGKLDDYKRLQELACARMDAKSAGRMGTSGLKPSVGAGRTSSTFSSSVAGVTGRPALPVASSGKRRGRPLEVDRQYCLSATKPWEKERMSRRTWYRRREKREGK
jgi:hypothetical protein